MKEGGWVKPKSKFKNTILGKEISLTKRYFMWKVLRKTFPFFRSNVFFSWKHSKTFECSNICPSIAFFLFLPLLVVWVHHWLCKLIHDYLPLISHPPQLEEYQIGYKREESYKGYIRFKSAVSPLFLPFGEAERKKNDLIELGGTHY